eukprot:TRINITY_DN6785_c0_g1_i1.p1 TRINITY_DN6785_c0_g1~~TRINITY_DN6785_c0_g1_i1.p1  ORF type:complete len:192 (-),score=13.58 TRINITY_DN6785_c0_g1_i1:162-737(-)
MEGAQGVGAADALGGLMEGAQGVGAADALGGLMEGAQGVVVSGLGADALGAVDSMGGAAGAAAAAAGMVSVAGDAVGGEWASSFFQLQLLYFVSHYLFASQAAHVGTLYAAFLAMQVAAGVPDTVAAMGLAATTNVFGAITHYSSGQAALFAGSGFLKLPDIFRMGAITAAVNMAIWVVVGGLWWKLIGVL